jgi:hypothetical protein
MILLMLASAGAEGAASKEGILAFKAVQSGAKSVPDWILGSLPAMMGKGGEWYLIGLSQTGQYDLSACREALLAYRGDRGGMDVLREQRVPCDIVQAAHAWELWDVDTPEGMEALREVLNGISEGKRP